jgi:hypothetical protein
MMDFFNHKPLRTPARPLPTPARSGSAWRSAALAGCDWQPQQRVVCAAAQTYEKEPDQRGELFLKCARPRLLPPVALACVALRSNRRCDRCGPPPPSPPARPSLFRSRAGGADAP